MDGIELLRKYAEAGSLTLLTCRQMPDALGKECDDFGNCRDCHRFVCNAIADKIEREIDEAANEAVDALSAREMHGNARWHSAIVEGAESDCKVEFELISRYWLPRPRFEDGEPVQFGDEFVTELDDVGEVEQIDLREGGWSVWSYSSHKASNTDGPLKRPEPPKVLDADGVEIKVGDKVLGIGREQHAYKVLEPKSGDEYAHGRFTVKCIDLTDSKLVVYADPSSLTHERPEPEDSWEQIEADVNKGSACRYFGVPDSEEECGKCTAQWGDYDLMSCAESMARDVLRRAKKLAGVE